MPVVTGFVVRVPVVQGVVRPPVVRFARCADVVRGRVVRSVRGAGVARRPVVRNARRFARDRVLGVIPPHARCADVIPCWCGATEGRYAGVIACGGWLNQTPVVPRDCVPEWCAEAGGTPTTAASAPNKPMQPTAARARSLLFWQFVWCARGG